jgi:hypothetical protein
MIVVWALTDVDVAGAEFDQSLDRFVLVIDGRGRQIEMDAILARLLLRDRPKQDPESGVIRRHETDLVMGLVVDPPVQSSGPEAYETEWIIRIEAESLEPRTHLALCMFDRTTDYLRSHRTVPLTSGLEGELSGAQIGYMAKSAGGPKRSGRRQRPGSRLRRRVTSAARPGLWQHRVP